MALAFWHWQAPWWLLLTLGWLVVQSLLLALLWSTPGNWRRHLLWLAAAGLLATLALARPVLQWTGTTHTYDVWLDLSPSTAAQPWRTAPLLRAHLENHLGPAAYVRLHAPGAANEPWPALLPVATASAWQFVLPAEVSAPTAPISLPGTGAHVVLTDQLRALTVPPTAPLLILAAPATPDAGITDLTLRLPDPAAPTLQITAHLRANYPTRRQLTFWHAGAVLATQEVSLPAGQSVRAVIAAPALPGVYRVTLAPADAFVANDSAAVRYQPADQPALLWITRPGPHVAPPGATIIAPAELSAWRNRLPEFQAVILADVPAAELPAGADQWLESYVTDFGGGLFLFAPQRGFGPGGYAPTRLEALSPLSAYPPDLPPRTINLLLDASGSMAGQLADATKYDLAVAAVLGCLRTLPARDQVNLVTYATGATQIWTGPIPAPEPQRTDHLRTLATQLRRQRPNGPTNADTVLPTLARAPGLTILFSDGQIPSLAQAQWLDYLRTHNQSLVVIAPPDATGAVQQLVTASAGRWLDGRDPRLWLSLFTQAVTDTRLGTARQTPLTWTGYNQTGTTSAWTEVYPQPGVTPTLLSTDTPPRALAALWPRGLGRVATLAAQVDAGIPAKILASVTAATGQRQWVYDVQNTDEGYQITVDTPAAGGWQNELHLEAMLYGSQKTYKLTPIAPGRYRTLCASPDATVARLIWRQPTGDQLAYVLSLPQIASAEIPAVASVQPAPASSTLRPLSGPQPPLWHPHLVGRAWPLAPLLWLACGVILLIVLARRRISR